MSQQLSVAWSLQPYLPLPTHCRKGRNLGAVKELSWQVWSLPTHCRDGSHKRRSQGAETAAHKCVPVQAGTGRYSREGTHAGVSNAHYAPFEW